MKTINWKRLAYDLMIDIIAGVLIGIGVYNFAANSGFPLAGVSGIALIFYRLVGIPIGLGSILLNIPIILGCYKTLGKEFFLRSMRSLLITSFLTDYIAPLFPAYSGDRMLAAICTGIVSGLGYALIFMNNSSTAGMDFVSVAIQTKKPHISLGKIVFVLDFIIVLIGGVVFKDVDATIYGLIITYLLTYVIDKIMYGIDAGKMTFIITENGQAVVDVIDQYIERGATILHGYGSYTKQDKEIVMCACNNKQMYIIKKMIKEVDKKAFIVVMESNEVVGEGFKDE
ncbi:YitT family protein [Mediterraneibacter agrestimuris]|uniref:YitT family protein n=1 Tax=Mediterraneibacter agrestimuris TaxID=2941333 RepID=UPI00203BD6CA|nr:YitT family protein [Mediterraneibacter agrestimuris]